MIAVTVTLATKLETCHSSCNPKLLRVLHVSLRPDPFARINLHLFC
jgi:hypothetical protein